MGGYGSGPKKQHENTDSYFRLSIDKLNRGGFLEPGTVCLWTWTRNHNVLSSIKIAALDGSVLLSFRIKDKAREWQNVEQVIALEHTHCNYGGTRPWFLCPKCGRRVSVLYGRRAFNCRTCHYLAYPSQAENQAERCYRRANKLRQRMGGEPGKLSSIPKPKWMRWKTYERMIQEITFLEDIGISTVAKKSNTIAVSQECMPNDRTLS